MTIKANARLAGATFLLYIVVGITGLMLPERPDTAGIRVLISFLIFVIALGLAVSLYALTRSEDRDLARFALLCRVGESLFAAVGPVLILSSAWATAQAARGDATALGELIDQIQAWNATIAATLFAIGSTIYCYLFLRGRLIPIPLAWLGLVASVLLMVALPLELAGYLSKTVINILWAPMALFEIPLGVWLLVSRRWDTGST